MYSGVPSSSSEASVRAFSSGGPSLGWGRFVETPLYVPSEMIEPSGLSGGGGSARTARFGETGADSYTYMSFGVTSAKRNFLPTLLGGRVLLLFTSTGDNADNFV